MFIDVIKNNMKKEWDQYTKHYFGELVATGKLKQSSFDLYILQDIIYLHYYGKCWKKWSLLIKNNTEIEFVRLQIASIVDEEMAFRNQNKIQDIGEIKILDATKEYIDYMNQVVAKNNDNELFFVLLGCFVGYAYLGKYILQFKINKKYLDWIKIYTSEHFLKAIDKIMEMATQRWKKLNNNERDRCQKIFKDTLILEKNFFDQVL